MNLAMTDDPQTIHRDFYTCTARVEVRCTKRPINV